MIQILFPIYLACIFGIPFVGSVLPVLSSNETITKALLLFTAPIIFSLGFVFISGILSKPAQKAIVAGKFPRDLKNPIYGLRRLYGICWTSVFYFSPLYYVILSVPILKKILFRMFGYKGSLNFTVYADTWIRDLPLLQLEDGAYLANKSTIGTNMCLGDGSILIDSVYVGKNGLIGHLAMLGPGSKIYESAEIGVGVGFGIRSVVKTKSKIQPKVCINHGVIIGNHSEVGTMSFVGTKVVIKDNIKIPAGANIPAGMIIENQDQIHNIISSESSNLNDLRMKLAQIMLNENAQNKLQDAS